MVFPSCCLWVDDWAAKTETEAASPARRADDFGAARRIGYSLP